MTLAEQAVGRPTDARAWHRGARGERLTGWLFGRLPERCFVLTVKTPPGPTTT